MNSQCYHIGNELLTHLDTASLFSYQLRLLWSWFINYQLAIELFNQLFNHVVIKTFYQVPHYIIVTVTSYQAIKLLYWLSNHIIIIIKRFYKLSNHIIKYKVSDYVILKYFYIFSSFVIK